MRVEAVPPAEGWPAPGTIAVSLAGSGAIGLLAYRRGALSRGGVFGALVTGTTIMSGGGPLPAGLLLVFFTSSTALSHWRREGKRATASEFAKDERRDLWQVLANGGAATALVVCGRMRPQTLWLGALIGALATVNADTWATEIGMLSHRAPRLITTLRVVRPGTSGGVTPIGSAAAVLGAVVIGVVAACGLRFTGTRAAFSPSPSGAILIAVTAGFAGAMSDSLLGATVQTRYYCPACDVPTERQVHRCGTKTTQSGGWRWCDNDAVNFISSWCGAAVGWGIERVARSKGRHVSEGCSVSGWNNGANP